MSSKSRTATLILQKSQKQRSNPQSNSKMSTQNMIQMAKNNENISETRKNLSMRHLSHYDAFSLTFRSQKQMAANFQESENANSKSNLQVQYCQLEKQNYRLIEANFNLLSKFIATIETMRNDIMRVIQFLEQYQYVIAVQTLYEMLDILRKIDDVNSKETHQSIKLPDMYAMKRELSSMRSLAQSKEPIIQPRVHADSIVQQYSNPSLPKQKKPLHPLQICIGVSISTYSPPFASVPPASSSRLGPSVPLGLHSSFETGTPHFTQNDSHHYGLSFDQPQPYFHEIKNSRVNSLVDVRRKPYPNIINNSIGEIQEYSYYEIDVIEERARESRGRPSSQQNIKVFKGNNKKNVGNQGQLEDYYRILFSQASSVEYLLSRD